VLPSMGSTAPMATVDLHGLVLPPVFPPAGTYLSAVLHGDLLHTAGHIPLGADGTLVCGRLGDDLDVEAGRHAAVLAALSLLATVRATLGDLDRVDQFLRVGGVVHATPDFVDHTTVIDAASDVFVRAFGERGRHARLAVGVSSLPAGIALEVEATLAVRPGTRR
jgi:enamine deaminase RidA (YjgF/YER057c/UK114 family)